MTKKTFMQELAEIEARLDKLEEQVVDQKIQLFAIGIELDEIKRGLDDIQIVEE